MRYAFIGVLLVLGSACGGGVQVGSDPPPMAPAADPAPMAADPGVPRTYADGNRIVMPVTFADGVTVELVYPPELGLERLEPTSEVIIAADAGGREVRRDVRLVGAGKLTELEGSEGADYLLLSFGEWKALVIASVDHGAPPLTAAELQVWTEDLAVEEADTGFPTVVLGPRLRIARTPDDQAAPVMLVLDAGDLDPGLALTRPDSCAVAALEETWRCDEDASVIVSPYGDPDFQDAVLKQVDVRSVRPAP